MGHTSDPSTSLVAFLCALVSGDLPSLLSSPSFLYPERQLKAGRDSRCDETHAFVIDGAEALKGEGSCRESHNKPLVDPGSEPGSLTPSLVSPLCCSRYASGPCLSMPQGWAL